jgi:hypothetical protein
MVVDCSISKQRNVAGSLGPRFYAISFLVATLSSWSIFCDLRCVLLESNLAAVVNALSPGHAGSPVSQHASRNASSGERSPLAVCVAVRDDPVNTLEWVEYHKDMGVDTFYMMVTDDPNFRELEEVLMPWIQTGTVQLFALPFVNPKTVSQLQIAIYSACLDSVRYAASLQQVRELLQILVVVFLMQGSAQFHWILGHR